jgi:hypothetical protein
MAKYQSEIMTVINNKTEKQTHFIRICDVWRRCTAADNRKRFSEATGYSALMTTNDGKFTRHYTTLTFDFEV